MPFFWVNSVFVVFFILISLIFLYYHKNNELLNSMFYNGGESNVLSNFNFLW